MPKSNVNSFDFCISDGTNVKKLGHNRSHCAGILAVEPLPILYLKQRKLESIKCCLYECFPRVPKTEHVGLISSNREFVQFKVGNLSSSIVTVYNFRKLRRVVEQNDQLVDMAGTFQNCAIKGYFEQYRPPVIPSQNDSSFEYVGEEVDSLGHVRDVKFTIAPGNTFYMGYGCSVVLEPYFDSPEVILMSMHLVNISTDRIFGPVGCDQMDESFKTIGSSRPISELFKILESSKMRNIEGVAKPLSQYYMRVSNYPVLRKGQFAMAKVEELKSRELKQKYADENQENPKYLPPSQTEANKIQSEPTVSFAHDMNIKTQPQATQFTSTFLNPVFDYPEEFSSQCLTTGGASYVRPSVLVGARSVSAIEQGY